MRNSTLRCIVVAVCGVVLGAGLLTGCGPSGAAPTGDTKAKYMERMNQGSGNKTGPGIARPGMPGGGGVPPTSPGGGGSYNAPR